jgi:hypothetical protein
MDREDVEGTSSCLQQEEEEREHSGQTLCRAVTVWLDFSRIKMEVNLKGGGGDVARAPYIDGSAIRLGAIDPG